MSPRLSYSVGDKVAGVVPGWDSDFGLSYIPKAELFGVAGVGQEAANCR